MIRTCMPAVLYIFSLRSKEKENAVPMVVVVVLLISFSCLSQEVPVSDGIELLQMVLNFEMKDPLILSCVLTNVSALFPFVTYKPELLPHVFSKV